VRRLAERQIERRRDFAREPQNAEAVRPVRGDFEVDDGIAVRKALDGRDLEAAEADRRGNFVGRRLDVDELAEP